jgi:hypothetical protein
MEPLVDIAFDCLPLRSVVRIDVPLDASRPFRARCQQLQRAIEAHGSENAYFLYNTRCVLRMANSDVINMVRFSFDGTVITDRSDRKAERADLTVRLTAETCGGLPADVLAWFRRVVEQAVLIEFDRFIAAGARDARISQLSKVASVADLADFSGLDV